MKPPVLVVGVGRLGGALARALSRAGYDVSVLSRTPVSKRRAQALRLRIAGEAQLRAARIVFFAVPDSEIASAYARLCVSLSSTAVVAHCAGSRSLAAFGTKVLHSRASFHPLVAISAPSDSLAGSSVAIAAESAKVSAQLRTLARDLGMTPIRVQDVARAAYHACAVMAAGGVVATLASAVSALELAGVGERDALKALIPLAQSALRGVALRGLRGGLTGPVVRGDFATVRAHLRALPPSARAVYRALLREMQRIHSGDAGEGDRQLFRPASRWHPSEK